MPTIKSIEPRTLGFSLRPEVSITFEFSDDEFSKSFLIKIDYIITNNSIKPKEIERGLFYKGIIKSDKTNLSVLFKKDGILIRPAGFLNINFEITFQPIFISPKYALN